MKDKPIRGTPDGNKPYDADALKRHQRIQDILDKAANEGRDDITNDEADEIVRLLGGNEKPPQ